MSPARPFDALLCDLDGVLRIWDPLSALRIERRHRLRIGSLTKAAFAAERLLPAVLGEVSDDEWRRSVAVALVGEYGVERAAGAVADWSAPIGRVDEAALALVRRAREAGIATVVVCNATTRLDQDLAALGLDVAVDAVVNSSRIGAVKPDPEIYLYAAEAATSKPERCLFVDDLPANVAGAEAVGMAGLLYAGPATLTEIANLLGLSARPA